MRIERGQAFPLDAPGFGVEWRESALAAVTVKNA
jgi:hypothetical protein